MCLSSTLLGKLSIRFRSMAVRIWVHSAIRASVQTLILRRQRDSGSSQTSLVVLRSVRALCRTQVLPLRPSLTQHVLMELDLCKGASSCWNRFGTLHSSGGKPYCSRIYNESLYNCLLPNLWQQLGEVTFHIAYPFPLSTVTSTIYQQSQKTTLETVSPVTHQPTIATTIITNNYYYCTQIIIFIYLYINMGAPKVTLQSPVLSKIGKVLERLLTFLFP